MAEHDWWKRVSRAMSAASKGLLGAAEASREAHARQQRGEPPVSNAEVMRRVNEALGHLGDAAEQVSPALGAAVRAASVRAVADAHRRVVARHLDGYADGLDEGGAASGAPEGTGGLVVDVAARRADEEGLHEAEGTPDAGLCECEAPVVPAVWVDVRTMRAVEDSVRICSRCSRVVGPGMVQ